MTPCIEHIKSIETIVATWRPFEEAPMCGAQPAHLHVCIFGCMYTLVGIHTRTHLYVLLCLQYGNHCLDMIFLDM